MVGWIVAGLATPATSQPPTLETVLVRAGLYVIELQRQLSGIVAEEDYVQDVKPSISGTFWRVSSRVHRELKSDLLLVRPVGSNRWMQFRDVLIAASG